MTDQTWQKHNLNLLKVLENLVSQVIFIPNRIDIAPGSLADHHTGRRIEWRLDGLPVDAVEVDLDKSQLGSDVRCTKVGTNLGEEPVVPHRQLAS